MQKDFCNSIGTTRTSLDALFRVAFGGGADIECVLTNSKSKRSCELANRERVGETHALVWNPRETQVPPWDPFVSKLVPDETHSSSKLGGSSGLCAEFLKSPSAARQKRRSSKTGPQSPLPV
jgi:hypothetical protein